jgi:hypothetical protein
MPLTPLQLQIARLLSANRSPDSYLAGGAALHFSPNSKRYSNDLDYFHDSVERVASAFQSDKAALEAGGFEIALEMNQPGYLRALVSLGSDRTKIEWAHDSAWRFMPTVHNPDAGYQLHPIDLAVNKALALAGRDEARDYVDILHIDRSILALGPLCWAAAGKDPGFSPRSLLELLKRRGRHRPEDFAGLMVTEVIDVQGMKGAWLRMLDEAEAFIRNAPPNQTGCLYYSPSAGRFVDPQREPHTDDAVPHYGRPGGVLPEFYPGEPLSGG